MRNGGAAHHIFIAPRIFNKNTKLMLYFPERKNEALAFFLLMITPGNGSWFIVLARVIADSLTKFRHFVKG